MGGVCAFSIHNRLFHQLDNNSCLFTEQAGQYHRLRWAQEFPEIALRHCVTQTTSMKHGAVCSAADSGILAFLQLIILSAKTAYITYSHYC